MNYIAHGNIANARTLDAEDLKRLLRDDPLVIGFTEAYRLNQSIAKYDRIRVAGDWGPEENDVAVYVCSDLDVLKVKMKAMHAHWWGPFTGRRRSPRRYYFVKVRDCEGRKHKYLVVHFPPGGPDGKNSKAWKESARACKRWLKRRRRAVVFGDINANAAEIREYIAPRKALVSMGNRVCGAVYKRYSGTTYSRNAPKGMHGWFATRLERRR